MFVYSVKASNLKFIAALAASALALILTFTLVPSDNDFVYPEDTLPAVKNLSASEFKNIASNDERVRFLAKFGWTADPMAREVCEVTIPQKFDSVYSKYNELQIAEGLDLSNYKGKTVKRYTYTLINYDYDGTVIANLLIYKDRVIGGDVCSLDINGFVHGLSKENKFIG